MGNKPEFFTDEMHEFINVMSDDFVSIGDYWKRLTEKYSLTLEQAKQAVEYWMGLP